MMLLMTDKAMKLSCQEKGGVYDFACTKVSAGVHREAAGWKAEHTLGADWAHRNAVDICSSLQLCLGREDLMTQ